MFQFPINAMIAIVAIPGDIIGSAILWKEYNSLAPSILAASTSAGGITDKMYCLKKNTVPGAATAGHNQRDIGIYQF